MLKKIQPLFHLASAVVASVQWIKESLQQLKVCLKDAPLSHSNGATTCSNENCMVCEHFEKLRKGGRPKTVQHPGGHYSQYANHLIRHIDSISPLSLNAPGTQPPSVSDNNNLPVLDHLRCPLCFEILDQPLELSCNSIVCAKCLKAWLVESAKVECPCCFNHDHEPLAPSHIKTAPTLVLNLLNDVVVHCSLCSRDMKASGYQGHICELSPTQEEMRSASLILQRAASLSPEQPVLKFSTGGAPLTFVHVTNGRNPTTSSCTRTVKQRCRELDAIRSIVSGDLCHKYDLQLAAASCEATGTSKVFQKYMDDLRTLQSSQAELARAQESLIILEQTTTCSVVKFVDVAQRHPALLPKVTATSLQFKKLLKLFGQCHSIYDRSFLDDNAIHKLEQATAEFLQEFRVSFPDASITPKMHLLEDHTLEWARNWHARFGLLGERELNRFTPDSMSYTEPFLQCTTGCNT
ncbi:hypothetical protein EMCRGX_G031654 [Ephydatia muelleri]